MLLSDIAADIGFSVSKQKTRAESDDGQLDCRCAGQGEDHGMSEARQMTDEQKPPDEPIESELLRDDPTFADIVIPFVQGLAERLRIMEDSIRAADFDALKVAAHQLKGSGGGYGYPQLTAGAAQLEQSARNAAVESCVKDLEELKKLIARIVVPPQPDS